MTAEPRAAQKFPGARLQLDLAIPQGDDLGAELHADLVAEGSCVLFNP